MGPVPCACCTAIFAVHVLLPPLLAEVSSLAPALDLAVLPPAQGVDSLLSGEIDFVIDVAGRVSHPDLARTPLLEEDFSCLLRADHTYADGHLSKKRYAELEHVLVAPGGKSGGIVDRVLEAEASGGAGGIDPLGNRGCARSTGRTEAGGSSVSLGFGILFGTFVLSLVIPAVAVLQIQWIGSAHAR